MIPGRISTASFDRESGLFDIRDLNELNCCRRDLGITAETPALFVQFWLTIMPPLPGDAQVAAQVKDKERYEGFIETLGRRLQKGQSFLREIPEDILPPPDGEPGPA